VLAASIRQALINSTTWQHKQRFAQRSRFIHSPCRDQTGLRASLERRASRDQSQHSTGTRWNVGYLFSRYPYRHKPSMRSGNIAKLHSYVIRQQSERTKAVIWSVGFSMSTSAMMAAAGFLHLRQFQSRGMFAL